MKRKTSLYLLVSAMAFISMVGSEAVAQRPYRASDQQLRTLLTRIENRADLFRNSVDRALDRSTINNTTRETEINQYVSDFQAATNRLRERFTSRNSVAADVQEVLNRGRAIDSFMRANRLDTASERNWQNLRADLDTLAGYYNVSWNWDSGGYNNEPYDRDNDRRGYDRRGGNQRYNTGRLEGTFTLDPQRSDDARQVADRAVQGLSAQEAERVRRMIERRLDAPTQISLNVTGRRVSMASTSAQQVSFDADGRPQVETRPNGRTVRTTATLTGNNRLTVSSTGDRGSDFSVTFDAIEGGRAMRVTRQLYTERLSQPVTVTSIYNRTSEIAELDLYRDRPSRDDRYDNRNTTVSGNYHVPDGTRLTAVLDNNLNTEQVREGDRFTMTVRSPSAYAGAIVEGHVAKVDRSGRIAGNSELALEFDTIRLRNGSSHTFHAFIDQVRTPEGKTIRVDNEGGVRESRGQTQRTVTRAGIGAAIGAIIGGIAGGGSGAAVGAAIGAGAGTGSVLLQGRDDVNLAAGTEFTLSSITSRN